MKLHAWEVELSDGLVQALVAEQFPHLADLAIRTVRSTGTVNFVYRLGAQLYLRLPRVADWAEALKKELDWLPRLAPRFRLQTPEPVARGEPSLGYPFTWAIYRWIDGEPYREELVADERRAAVDLARFVTELRRVDTAGAPRAGRRPLAELDTITREAISAAGPMIDARAAAAWSAALAAPAWDGLTPVWIHADLLRPNLIVSGGRLRAVIDFGEAGAGDPAADVIPAWSVFGETGRAAFRQTLGVDDGVWSRARGYALHQAALIVPYYAETNPVLAELARRTIEQIALELGLT